MVVTFEVLKLSKLISSRRLQPANKYSVFSNNNESKCDKSINFILRTFKSKFAEKKTI